jgi:hypothetical protein
MNAEKQSKLDSLKASQQAEIDKSNSDQQAAIASIREAIQKLRNTNKANKTAAREYVEKVLGKSFVDNNL